MANEIKKARLVKQDKPAQKPHPCPGCGSNTVRVKVFGKGMWWICPKCGRSDR